MPARRTVMDDARLRVYPARYVPGSKMMETGWIWRPTMPGDLPAIVAIADRVHPDFPEDEPVIAERLELHPQGTFLLQRDGRPAGYAISHPWKSGTVPALNQPLGALPRDPDILYLHDVALLPEARGSGAGRWIVEHLAAHAHPWPAIHLVAVNGSIPIWERLGFVVEEAPHLADKLRSYEPAARLMVRRLEDGSAR